MLNRSDVVPPACGEVLVTPVQGMPETVPTPLEQQRRESELFFPGSLYSVAWNPAAACFPSLSTLLQT